ncbi:MAG TPA: phage virion morphogenesis protein [Tahibacter sp.]|uniref:phage virion morphogenesis protein n=1 Tax=Tahibacter sp. TaxID=2056211 RepID=UPI002B6338FB|nr:phage virion morphogenesis protein [Tahibacter sp.]HSX60258.1 phage virion morphogenesis protein [Tahibacter sp.]
MSLFEFRIEWDDTQFQASGARLQQTFERASPLMADLAEGLLHSTQDRFVTSTAPDGRPWAPLAPSTRLSKRGPKILVEDGYLSGLLRPSWTDNTAGVETAPLPYAQVQQDGGRKTYEIKPRAKTALSWPGGRHPTAKVIPPPLPARPYMGLSKSDQAFIVERVHWWLGRAFGGRGA